MRILSALVVLALIGCTREADVMPLNDAATAAGIPKLSATLYGTGNGPVAGVMADGEMLTGHNEVLIGGAIGTGFATASTPHGPILASGTTTMMSLNNPLIIAIHGDRGTIMQCQGMAGNGHGVAQCRTGTGAEYQVMF